MADQKTGGESQSQLTPEDFRFTEEQMQEVRNSIFELLVSFQRDKRLINDFIKSPFDYLQENHPISFLSKMDTEKPELVFSFNRAVRRLKLEVLSGGGGCLACILSVLTLIFGYLFHVGLSVELLRSVISEVVLILADFFGVNDKVRAFMEVIGGLSTDIAPLSLARRFCRLMGLCKKMTTSIDVDTIHSTLSSQQLPTGNQARVGGKNRGGNLDF